MNKVADSRKGFRCFAGVESHKEERKVGASKFYMKEVAALWVVSVCCENMVAVGCSFMGGGMGGAMRERR